MLLGTAPRKKEDDGLEPLYGSQLRLPTHHSSRKGPRHRWPAREHDTCDSLLGKFSGKDGPQAAPRSPQPHVEAVGAAGAGLAAPAEDAAGVLALGDAPAGPTQHRCGAVGRNCPLTLSGVQ